MLGYNGIESFSLTDALAEMVHSFLNLGEGLRPGAQFNFLLTSLGLCILYAICVALPNSNQIMGLNILGRECTICLEKGFRISWRPGALWGLILGSCSGSQC